MRRSYSHLNYTNAIYSELEIARKSAVNSLTGRDSKADRLLGKLYTAKKGREGFKYPLTGGCCHGEAVSKLEVGTLYNWLDPKSEAGAKIREAPSYPSSPGYFGSKVTEAVV